ncbi:hypothetical protein [Rhizobium etli]|nr:hypothetical protein [Rhizobium etli]
MDRRAKLSTGTSDRPSKETIAGSGPGIPDDSGRKVEPTDEEAKGKKTSLLNDRRDDLKDKLDEQIDLPQRGSP